MKNILTSMLVLIATMLYTSFGVSAQNTAATDSVKTTVIKVGNLHCNNDMPTIKKRLLNQEGIDDVAFTDRNNEVSTFTITYHTSTISEAAIKKAVESTPGCDDPGDKPYRVVSDTRKKKKG